LFSSLDGKTNAQPERNSDESSEKNHSVWDECKMQAHLLVPNFVETRIQIHLAELGTETNLHAGDCMALGTTLKEEFINPIEGLSHAGRGRCYSTTRTVTWEAFA